MGYIGTKPADAALTSADIADGVVTAAKLATDSVETAKVKDINITTAKIKDLNVTAGKMAATQDLSTKTITLPATVAGLGTGITNAQLAGSIDVTSKITGCKYGIRRLDEGFEIIIEDVSNSSIK